MPGHSASSSCIALAPIYISCLACTVATAEARHGARGSLGILGESPLLQEGGMAAYATAKGGGAWGGNLFAASVVTITHCGAGAAGGGVHIALFANTCVLA